MAFAGQSEAQQGIEIPRSGGGFYPELYTDEFKERFKVKSNITPQEIAKLISDATQHVNESLYSWAVKQIELGVNALEDVPFNPLLAQEDDEGNPISPKIKNYQAAVYSHAFALLLENEFNYDLTRHAGKDRTEKMRPQISEAYRNSLAAIRALKDEEKTRVSVV